MVGLLAARFSDSIRLELLRPHNVFPVDVGPEHARR
jgi:hypothetical protein